MPVKESPYAPSPLPPAAKIVPLAGPALAPPPAKPAAKPTAKPLVFWTHSRLPPPMPIALCSYDGALNYTHHVIQ